MGQAKPGTCYIMATPELGEKCRLIPLADLAHSVKLYLPKLLLRSVNSLGNYEDKQQGDR